MLKQSKDPQGLLMNLMTVNPQVSTVIQEVQANGGDAKGLFYRKAKEMGVDPNLVLSMMK